MEAEIISAATETLKCKVCHALHNVRLGWLNGQFLPIIQRRSWA